MKLILANRGQETFEVRRGERNVQLAFAPVLHAMLDETLRRAGAFGSTGR